ncbi:MAG: GGDEF domain-containing protein, partial [Woeseia sp.]
MKGSLHDDRMVASAGQRGVALMPLSFTGRQLRRLAGRPDAEHVQIAIRLAIVIFATLYFYSSWFADGAVSAGYVHLARIAAAVSMLVSLVLAGALLLDPGVSIPRRIAGLLHDIVAISVALFLGEGAAAGLAVVYLWVTLGNGFRYGNAWLYGSALLSIASFSTVIWFSEFWRTQATLSLTMLVVIALIPPYVGALLSSLHKAKALLRKQATIDVLTGLLNRIETEMTIERQLESQHDGHALLFCDLDLFKDVNDKAGHAAGDKLLADVAGIIADCTEPGDVTGRLGGDEFCVLLPHASMERARQVAEEIRNRVSGYRLAWGREYYSVGISIGVAPTSAVQ